MGMGVSPENLTPVPEEWRSRLAADEETIARIVAQLRREQWRIAVIGIKPRDTESGRSSGPAHSVPAWLQQQGFEIVPVPVYYPELTELLGVPVHRSLDDVHPPAELVQLFRRPIDVPKHLDEILRAKPRVVWMQLGIQHEEVAEALARAGIFVVQNHCLQVELQRPT